MFKTNSEIESKLYQMLNKSNLTDLLTGELCKGDRPTKATNSTEPRKYQEDVVITTTTNQNQANTRLQNGFVNANIYTRETKYGTPDYDRIERIYAEVVVAAVFNEDGIAISDDKTFTVEIESINTFRDQDLKEMFFTNIRLLYNFKN